MKKLIIILLLLFSAINVQALTYKDATIEGSDEASLGEEVKLTFNINFQGFVKDRYQGDGILNLAYDLKFDNKVLDIVDITTDGFKSIIYEVDDNSYLVLNQVDEELETKSKCLNESLYCDNYEADITFYVKDAQSDKVDITLDNLAVGLVNLENLDANFVNNKINSLESIPNITKTITIKKKDADIEYQSIIAKPSSKVDIKEIVKEHDPISKTKEKSSNSNLKSLEIEGYELDFDKDEKFYDLVIDDSINELNVKATPEDPDATYEIIGADDLNKNSRKITVEVKAPDGTKTKYTISLKSKNNVVTTEEEKPQEFKLENKHLVIGFIILCSLILLILIIVLINKIRDRKLDKGLRNF